MPLRFSSFSLFSTVVRSLNDRNASPSASAYVVFLQRRLLRQLAQTKKAFLAPALEKSHVARMNSVALDRTERWIETRVRPMVEKGESFDVGKEMVGVILSAIVKQVSSTSLEKKTEKPI
jgi:hypothetical protein